MALGQISLRSSALASPFARALESLRSKRDDARETPPCAGEPVADLARIQRRTFGARGVVTNWRVGA